MNIFNFKFKLSSIEKVSLLRKFTVLFTVMSFMPFIIITILFVILRNKNFFANIPDGVQFTVFMFIGFGTLVGFFGMRQSIQQLSRLTREAVKSLSNGHSAGNVPLSEESEIVQLTRTFSEVTNNLEENIKKLEASRQIMKYVLTKLATGISSADNINTFLDLIVEITANALDAKTGVLMLLDEEKQELYIKNSAGIGEKFRNMRVAVGDEGPGWVAKHKKPLLIPALSAEDLKNTENDPFLPPLLYAPMLYKDKLVGVLTVGGKLKGSSFTEEELLIISNLASQTAVAVENERLHQDVETTYVETVSALAMAVEARDPYSRGHSDRVAKYAVKIAEKLGLDQELIKDIHNAAELHDVGKIGINDDVLKKGSSLSNDETQIMRNHAVIGEGIVEPVRSLARLRSIIRHHHERYDGKGYPDGLSGTDIPIGARILALADSFDAMTTDRPYRKALSFEAAKEEIRKNIGIQFDKEIAEMFLSII